MQFSHKCVTFAQVFKDTTRFQEFVTSVRRPIAYLSLRTSAMGRATHGNLTEGSPEAIRTMARTA